MRGLIGPLLMATGVLDLLYVLVFHYRQLAAIAADGFFDAVEPAGAIATVDREAAFWHAMFGLMVLILGGLVHWTQARIGTLPAFLGWSLLVLGVVALILTPVSGFWLVPPQAVVMILASRQLPGDVSGSGAEGVRRVA